jgi:uncharacterized SAM-binding protein YcdF (DUF218 family)
MKQKAMLKWVVIAGVAGTLIWLGSLPIRMAIAAHQAPEPELILVLGGGTGREEAAAQIAKYHPSLEVWVSSGDGMPQSVYAIFQAAGVDNKRVHPDYRATDTVTNFTTLVSEFQQRGIQHLFLVTSDFHMPRAKAIATVVLGSRGIAFTPVAVPSNRSPESNLRIARDVGRSLLWVATGKTGASWGQQVISAAELGVNYLIP